jgi:hypothetical protein
MPSPIDVSTLAGSPAILVFREPHWDPARAEHVETYNRLIASVPGLAGDRLLSIGDVGPWRELRFSADALAIPVVHDEQGTLAAKYGVA